MTVLSGGSGAASGKRTALLLDDDESQRELMVFSLEKLGLVALSYSSVPEFLKAAARENPAVCLVDLHLSRPGEGAEVVVKLRKFLPPETAVLVVSGEGNQNIVAELLQLGADDYLLKPVYREMLATKLSRFVQTEAIEHSAKAFLPVPEGGAAATLRLETSVAAVDETGVILVGGALLAKGAFLQLDSEELSQGLGLPGPFRLLVTSTWMEKDQGYGARAEFDSTDSQLMAALRRWLVKG